MVAHPVPCEKCGKRAYPTKRDAIIVLQQMRDSGQIASGTGRVYRTHGSWHITSRKEWDGHEGYATGTLSRNKRLRDILQEMNRQGAQHE